MDQHPIVLRAGKPKLEEGLLCGRFLNEASEGFFRFMLGQQATDIIAEAYLQPNHSYSFENVTFAEDDKNVVGMALGFTANEHRNFSEKPLMEAKGYPALRVTAVKILLAPLMRILETIPVGDFYLLAIAIEKEHRGKGIGSTLMDFVEDRALAMDSKRLSLDVSARNVGARKLYKRRGMTNESQWPRRLPISALKFYRMTKSL